MAASGLFQRARPVACRGIPAAVGPLPPVPAPTQSRPEDCQSGVSTPKAPSISTPTHAVSAPDAPGISLSFAPFGQYPVAHRPSVTCWLAGGSRAVSTPACVAGPSLVRPPPRVSASNVQASEPRASARRPSPSAGARVPSPGCPVSPATGRLHYQPGPRPGRAPSTAPPAARGRSRPRPAPPPQGASSTGPQDTTMEQSLASHRRGGRGITRGV